MFTSLLYVVALPLSTNKISATSELYCTLSYSLTESPFGLDATIHAHVGRTVLYNKQIRTPDSSSIKSYLLSWPHLEARALCSSDFNTSMIAKDLKLTNLLESRDVKS
ncbi:hypothetical protein CMV_010066 [Castanea mollissima]|uniref:Uncharacterized protein n=1 Tax=Castanea mollissima TaxID=60419 RepID=A0A8J4R4L7_9ROSI|nr:hypothetical protein CMV_010066 [Castanea mollissima]